jgi:hypothetical protein
MTVYFVNNLSYNLNPSQLGNWFESAGELSNFGICTFNNNNFSGKCVIQYANDQGARRAIENLDRTFLNGRLVIFHFFDQSRINSRFIRLGKYEMFFTISGTKFKKECYPFNEKLATNFRMQYQPGTLK